MSNPAAKYTNSFGFQWTRHAKTQLDSYVGLPISRNRLFSVTGWPSHMEGQRILEAGSGAGRFTEVLLSTGAQVWSFDASEAVEANRANNGHSPNLHLFQADIFNIPDDIGLFDKVFCLGVLQHTPDPKRAFFELVKFVKPGGEIVIDVYKKTLFSRLQWKYFLRPFVKWIPDYPLYLITRAAVSMLLPLAIGAYKIMGSFGTRLFPIASYPSLGFPYKLHKEWSVLDTFDMYSPVYDQPQTLREVKRWFKEAKLQDVVVHYGPNGIVGKGKKS
ncbi:class I SAM-dependent methyltransferase [Candidatus Uhrbacteria bacterium]|nr:class I SAM-dependent methyltransferase [Candidatus Uhrbacteria bacterium]